MSRKIFVGSLQYSPIYKSHCCALGKQCEKYGYSVKYLFSREYEWLLPKEIKEKTIFIGKSTGITSAVIDGLNFKHRQKLSKILLEDRPDYIYMYNYHPFLNYYIAKSSKKCGSTFIQHVQEPYVENKKVYKGLHQYWLYLFEYLQGKLLKKTDIVVLSSNEAWSPFEKRYPHFSGSKRMIPLMYEDLGWTRSDIEDRKYITFIGPPVPAKGPETFLEIVEYSEKHNLSLDFLVISRLKIKSSRYYGKSNLKIFYKEKITDEEIADYMCHSLMTITPYKAARQSSVILTSYMYGTPVISTNVGGLREVVFHLKTGYLLDKNAKVEEWIEGINFIKDNLSKMSKDCRDYFVREFSETNWPRYFKDIFGGGKGKMSRKKLICEIGCGDQKVMEDSIGVDIRITKKVDIVADARNLPFKALCFDHVNSSHVIEHFPHHEVKAVLCEWVRVLKEGGTFELRCPDLRARTLLFFLKPSWGNVRNIYGGQDYPENCHKCGFSYRLLKELVGEMGIVNIKRVLDGYKGVPFIPSDLHITGVKKSLIEE